MTLKRRAFLTLIPLTLALAACGKRGQSGTSGLSLFAPRSEQIQAWTATGEQLKGRFASLELLKKAAGFTAGSPSAKRTVYVIFDPQCPHCGAVWQSTHRLWREAQFVWIPAGVMNDAETSVLQGTAILSSKTPIGAMEEQEALLSSGAGGLQVKNQILPADIKAAVQQNSQLLAGFGAESVPFIVGTDESTGKLVAIEGQVEPEELVNRLHWKRAATQ
ncbi:DsbC family protein [Paraburkholderia aspalathi]|nr:DsbC family protein [Paraburkholderia aspalathi]MBK3780436.1 DsbC family protein [Paraburkholderia aspalathi]